MPKTRGSRIPKAFSFLTNAVTKRNGEAQALPQSETRLRDTMDSMLEGCQIIGFDWRYLYVNDVVARQGRLAKEDLLGHTMMEMYPGIEETEMFGYLRRCMEQRLPHHMENEFVYPDGDRGWFELSIQPVPEGAFILSLDSTERKQAEEALRESTERLLKAQRVAKMGFLDWNLKTNDIVWSDQIHELYGVDRQAHDGNINSTMQLVHPDDAKFVEENLAMATKGEKEYDIDHRMLRPDGKVIWVHAQAELVRDADGNPESLLGTVVDITKRKQAEEGIRRQQEEQQTILDSVPALIFYKDCENRFLRVNRALVEASDIPRETWEGGSAFDLFPNQAEDYWRDDKAVIESGQALRNIIEPMETATGTRWYRTDKIPCRDADGQIIGIIGFSADITEQKRLEEQLLNAREELEGKVERQMLRKNPYGLTFRELTVLHLVAVGRSDKEIATELVISPHTVHKHVANTLAKMDAASRTEAATRALKEGLLE